MQIKQSPINFENIRFPRELEADNTVETIRRVLFTNAVLLRPESDFAVPSIEMNGSLKKALRQAKLQCHIRCGFDAIAGKLQSEKEGIANVCKRTDAPQGKRISRLILFSNDCAPRLYRHIEQLLTIHSPRLLCCLINMESEAFGHLINHKDNKIKVIMVENKNAVCEILRTMIVKPDTN
ncbi:MAG: hypothetical protein ABFD50_23110 [Smithella sp.]